MTKDEGKDSRVLWACDKCGSVYYLIEKPMQCNSCGGYNRYKNSGLVHPNNLVSFTKIQASSAKEVE